MFPKYAVCILCLLGPLGGHAKTSATRSVTKALQAAQGQDLLRHAAIGFYAVNLTQDQVIIDVNAQQNLIPTSTLKLITTAAALEMLGEDFCFETTLQYGGEIDEDGTLHGNIYIHGGGDPALGSSNFRDHYYKPYFMDAWVEAIQKMGIKRIAGTVIGDAQIYGHSLTPGTWTWEDVGNYYGARPSGLSIFDNSYTLFFRADAEEGVLTKIVSVCPPLPQDVQLFNHVRSSSINSNLVYIYGGAFHNTKVIRGTIPKGRKKFAVKGTIPDPAYWAAFTLHQQLQAQGVEVALPPTTVNRGGEVLGIRKDICSLHGPPLRALVRSINHDSVNLY
ncbi:MAG: D-alanyl-D-alanine carboxypeptidase/D-alanyl-D-alanine-endopeptidase, partial [Bacteroidota bacterium]